MYSLFVYNSVTRNRTILLKECVNLLLQLTFVLSNKRFVNYVNVKRVPIRAFRLNDKLVNVFKRRLKRTSGMSFVHRFVAVLSFPFSDVRKRFINRKPFLGRYRLSIDRYPSIRTLRIDLAFIFSFRRSIEAPAISRRIENFRNTT